MQVLVKNTYHCDLLECPEHIAKDLVQYQTEFDEWAVVNDHIVDLYSFTEWVNDNYLVDSIQKIQILSVGFTPTKEQLQLPYILY